MTTDQALAIGMRHHQSGQLPEAERLYRQVLAVEPNHPQALHLLGLVALQSRQFEAAVDLIVRAIRIERRQPAFYANLGEAYRHLGKFAEAAECYRQVLKLDPSMTMAQSRLGAMLHAQGLSAESINVLRTALRQKPDDVPLRTQLGHVLHDTGQLGEADTCFRRVVRDQPQSAEAHFNLATVLHGQGKLDEAAKGYRAALERDPNYADAYNNLGTVLLAQRQLDAAVEQFQTAIRIRPDFAVAHLNLASLYEIAGRLPEAEAAYRRAVTLDPRSAVAHTGLGSTLQKLNRIEEAMACYRQAIELDPRHAPAYLNWGNALQSLRRLNGAIELYEKVIELDPNSADAYNNMGVAWSEQGRRDEAIANCRRAIELNPGYARAYANLAVSLQAIGRLDEAVAHYRQAIPLDHEPWKPHGNLLYLLNYLPEMTPEAIFAEHREWGRRYADPLSAQAAPLGNDRTAQRRLRIGYVSPYFLAHAVNFFTEPILAAHDHAHFEVFCYSDVAQPDAVTARLKPHADAWRDTLTLSDEQLADQIRRDQIDILVDLTGHIGGSRLMTFARRPAPVQVTYIGYQNTTGMAAMDYRLTDAYSDPPGTTEHLHTEQLVRLPTTFFCYQPSADAPPVSSLSALANGFITFGSFNNFAKINAQVLSAWTALLASVPHSRLTILGDMTDSLRHRLQETFAQQGIAAERLNLVNRLPREEYLKLICQADIALDPFPFNGHTTTCDCLWQGVPVVTLSGNTYVSRFGGSGLATLGLDDWITASPEAYVETAARLASDTAGLAELRATLRGRMAASPLLDFDTFTRHLEAEYRRMWSAWCRS